MANSKELAARMFEERAEKGDRSDILTTLPGNGCPLSNALSVEHQDVVVEPQDAVR
jgi:hypothetical protein